jgi:hypothetical protein
LFGIFDPGTICRSYGAGPGTIILTYRAGGVGEVSGRPIFSRSSAANILPYIFWPLKVPKKIIGLKAQSKPDDEKFPKRRFKMKKILIKTDCPKDDNVLISAWTKTQNT